MRELAVGDHVDQYELTDLLARSGMASIFKGIDTTTGRAVALKVPHVQYESDVVFSERFRREEEVGQKLHHPNVVEILTPVDKSRMYMAMEFVEGRSLRALMNAKTPFTPEQAIGIARQILSALQYLHDHGVVHRDIKPENILLDSEGRPKILDFGIALFAAERRLTWAGFSNTLGTPDYMAPEQIRGRRGDPRTDVYAVGTLLYEMLTRNLPWDSANPRALLKAKTSEEPRPPSYFVSGFDPSLEAIILRAIERDPRDRYGTAKQMLADLENPSAVQPRDPALIEARRQARRPSRRILVALLAAAVLAALSSLVWLTARQRGPSTARPAATELRGR